MWREKFNSVKIFSWVLQLIFSNFAHEFIFNTIKTLNCEYHIIIQTGMLVRRFVFIRKVILTYHLNNFKSPGVSVSKYNCFTYDFILIILEHNVRYMSYLKYL